MKEWKNLFYFYEYNYELKILYLVKVCIKNLGRCIVKNILWKVDIDILLLD